MLGVIRRHWKPKSRNAGSRKKDGSESPKNCGSGLKEEDGVEAKIVLEEEEKREEASSPDLQHHPEELLPPSSPPACQICVTSPPQPANELLLLQENDCASKEDPRADPSNCSTVIDSDKFARTEGLLLDIKHESDQCKERLASLKQDFNKMEEMVLNLLQFKSRMEQLKHEKSSLSLVYESKMKKYLSYISSLEKENFLLLSELKTLEASNSAQQKKRDQCLSRLLLERLSLLEQENSSLLFESEQQRLEYEHCLDDVANQVVQALLAQKSLREECCKLQRRVHDLEHQNRTLTLMFQKCFTSSSGGSTLVESDQKVTISGLNGIDLSQIQKCLVGRSDSQNSQSEDSSESLASFCSHWSNHFLTKNNESSESPPELVQNSNISATTNNSSSISESSTKVGSQLSRPTTLNIIPQHQQFPALENRKNPVNHYGNVYEEVELLPFSDNQPSECDSFNTVVRKDLCPTTQKAEETRSKDEGYSTMSSDNILLTQTDTQKPESPKSSKQQSPERLSPFKEQTNGTPLNISDIPTFTDIKLPNRTSEKIFSLLTPQGFKSPLLTAELRRFSSSPSTPTTADKSTSTVNCHSVSVQVETHPVLSRNLSDPLVPLAKKEMTRSSSLQALFLTSPPNSNPSSPLTLPPKDTDFSSSIEELEVALSHSPIIPESINGDEDVLNQHEFTEDWFQKDNFSSPLQTCFTYDDDEVGNWSLNLTPEEFKTDSWQQQQNQPPPSQETTIEEDLELNSEATEFNHDFYRLCTGSIRSLPPIELETATPIKDNNNTVQATAVCKQTSTKCEKETKCSSKKESTVVKKHHRKSSLQTCYLSTKNHSETPLSSATEPNKPPSDTPIRPPKSEPPTRIPIISNHILDKNRKNLVKAKASPEDIKENAIKRTTRIASHKKSHQNHHHHSKKSAVFESKSNNNNNNEKLKKERESGTQLQQNNKDLVDLEKKLADEEGCLTIADKIQELNTFLSRSEERKRNVVKNKPLRSTKSLDNKEGYETSWVHVEANIDLNDPKARANLLDSMMASSSSSSEDEISEHKHNQKLHALHRFRRHRKRVSNRDAVISFIPRLRASIINRHEFFYRFGEKEREAVACFDFLNEFSTSPSDNEKLEGNSSAVPSGIENYDLDHISFSDSCAESFTSSTHSLSYLS